MVVQAVSRVSRVHEICPYPEDRKSNPETPISPSNLPAHMFRMPRMRVSAPLCKAKRQYPLTCKVSRYCLLTLHDSAVRVRGLHVESVYWFLHSELNWVHQVDVLTRVRLQSFTTTRTRHCNKSLLTASWHIDIKWIHNTWCGNHLYIKGHDALQESAETQYCGEPPWPRGTVLGLRPPGLEFRILCLEDSVISYISPSSGGSPGPV